uniref:Contactin-associated protein-like 2 n=1 Tax=Macrostomum lignano TaxID=282301 RepID=A0A1I8HE69_9PLAT
HSLQSNETVVHGFESPGSYQITLHYAGGSTAAASALAASAKRCEQFLRLRCRNSLRTLAAATGEVMTWWNNRQGRKMTSWGSVPNNLTMCSCGYLRTCSQPNYLCNCDGSTNDWAEDSGYIGDASMLPVLSVQVGDTGNLNEFAAVLVGPLVCWH